MQPYLKFLQAIADNDVRSLFASEIRYGDSWLKDGGTGAYFVAIRKLHRLEVIIKDPDVNYDVFKAFKKYPGKEGFLDTIADFRRYLMLWEAEARARSILGEIEGLDAPTPVNQTSPSTIRTSPAENSEDIDTNRMVPRQIRETAKPMPFIPPSVEDLKKGGPGIEKTTIPPEVTKFFGDQFRISLDQMMEGIRNVIPPELTVEILAQHLEAAKKLKAQAERDGSRPRGYDPREETQG